MSSEHIFPTEYILFESDEDLSREEMLYKRLTFIGAAAVSLLCYENEGEQADHLQNDWKYQRIRENDIVSDVWPLAAVASELGLGNQSRTENEAAPLIAWSVRLQALFVGFRGTHSAKDILSGIDVRQSTISDVASRFHSGFVLRARPYVALIRELAEKYNVVVCGHSLGGAMATIAAYQALVQGYGGNSAANVWQMNDSATNADHPEAGPTADISRGISTVTFGAPSMMVLERPGTTLKPLPIYQQNFHHIINRNDVVPFIVNSGIDKVNKNLMSTVNLIRSIGPEADWFFKVLGRVLEIWTHTNSPFGHYGRLYMLTPVEASATSAVQCLPITTRTQLCQPNADINLVKVFHSMEHYNYLLGQILPRQTKVRDIDNTFMTSEQFHQDCLHLPEIVENCAAMVYDDKIVVSATIEAPLIRFFTKNISFDMENRQQNIPRKDLAFEGSPGTNQTLTITHQMPADATKESLLDTAAAIQGSLRLHDSFGRSSLLQIPIPDMKYASMKDISLRSTFESIRDSMIIGLADQINTVQRLKLEGGGWNPESDNLPNNAKIVAALIDSLVVNADPGLILKNFTYASELVQKLWNPSASPGLPEASTTEAADKIADEILAKCPDELQELVAKMLRSFKEYKLIVPLNEYSWREQGRPTLAKVHPELETLTRALQKFGKELYDRDTNADDRIEKAIKQSRRLLLVMRFCHTIILTQLEPPMDWCVKSENILGIPGVFASLLPGYFSGTAAYAWIASFFGTTTGSIVALGWVGLAGIFGGVVGVAAWGLTLGTILAITDSPSQLQKGFDAMLSFSLQTLGLTIPKFSILETAITDALELDDLETDELDVEEWKERLRSGLKGFPTKPRFCQYEPTSFWVKWLFDVGKVGKLRRVVVDKLYVGVEGPTEAGKSLLLTTLTGSPWKFFRPGDQLEFRTTEIQTYTPPNLTAAFCDCPGSDDQDASIREMARLFRGLMNIIIFVVPYDSVRSERTQTIYTEIVKFIKQRREPRPFRILLNKVDSIDVDEGKPLKLRVLERKDTAIKEISRLGGFHPNLKIRTRQPYRGAIVASDETLNDIVQPYSTYAQMSRTGSRALSDCEGNEKRKIRDIDRHQDLYKLAEEGIIWDVESLRQWLRKLAPDSVPDSSLGRVLQQS